MTRPETPCTRPEASQFDFWLGEWDLTWPAEQTGGDPGGIATGSNRIRRVLGDCVIEEDFATGDGTFKGRSLSVFDPQNGLWRQTWVDSEGNYLLFTGGWDGETMELRTQLVERGDESAMNRMVFRDITADTLRWEWQGSRDAGETWIDLWTIDYRRRT